MFIVLEGIDGSGKSSLSRNIASSLPGISEIFTEPTRSGKAGIEIRRLLSESNEANADLRKKLLRLFLEDRLWDLDTNINPAIKHGHNVILDRYFFSTAAYQSADAADASKIVNEYLGRKDIRLPDLLIYLDLDPVLALDRIKRRRIEKEVFEYDSALQKVYSHYSHILNDHEFKFPVAVFDGSLSEEKLLNLSLDACKGLDR